LIISLIFILLFLFIGVIWSKTGYYISSGYLIIKIGQSVLNMKGLTFAMDFGMLNRKALKCPTLHIAKMLWCMGDTNLPKKMIN